MFGTGIGFHYNVSNLAETLKFYTEKLDFKIIDYDTVLKQARIATNSQDCLMGFAEAEPIIPFSTCITFEVKNIERAVQNLQQKGVEFKDGIIEVPNTIKLAPFTDPDGYSLMLYSRS